MRRRTKFGQNRSNRGRDTAIFGFFQDGGRPPSWICDACVRTTHGFGGLYHFAKFGWNRYSSFDNMQVLVFRDLGLKTPIHAPKIGVLGDLTP